MQLRACILYVTIQGLGIPKSAKMPPFRDACCCTDALPVLLIGDLIDGSYRAGDVDTEKTPLFAIILLPVFFLKKSLRFCICFVPVLFPVLFKFCYSFVPRNALKFAL